jgi:hypothetical protein
MSHIRATGVSRVYVRLEATGGKEKRAEKRASVPIRSPPGHQIDEPLCVSAGFAIVRDRVLGLCSRDILVLEDVWVHPASDHVLVRLDRVLTRSKAGVEECSIVAAGGVQIGNQPDQAVTGCSAEACPWKNEAA